MVLMVNGLFKSINKVNILKDISFSINENEILGLIGPNGSGNLSGTRRSARPFSSRRRTAPPSGCP